MSKDQLSKEALSKILFCMGFSLVVSLMASGLLAKCFLCARPVPITIVTCLLLSVYTVSFAISSYELAIYFIHKPRQSPVADKKLQAQPQQGQANLSCLSVLNRRPVQMIAPVWLVLGCCFAAYVIFVNLGMMIVENKAHRSVPAIAPAWESEELQVFGTEYTTKELLEAGLFDTTIEAESTVNPDTNNSSVNSVQPGQAVSLWCFEHARNLLARSPRPDRYLQARINNCLAVVKLKQGRYAEAEKLYEETIELYHGPSAPADDHQLFIAACDLAQCEILQEKYAPAADAVNVALKTFEVRDSNAARAALQACLAECRFRLGEYREAAARYYVARQIAESLAVTDATSQQKRIPTLSAQLLSITYQSMLEHNHAMLVAAKREEEARSVQLCLEGYNESVGAKTSAK